MGNVGIVSIVHGADESGRYVLMQVRTTALAEPPAVELRLSFELWSRLVLWDHEDVECVYRLMSFTPGEIP